MITPKDIKEIYEDTKRFLSNGGRVYVFPGHLDLSRWRDDPSYRKEMLSVIVGELVDVKLDGDELYGIIEITDPDLQKCFQAGNIASWSPAIGPLKTNTGFYDKLITHVAYTVVPYQTGLGRPVLMAETMVYEQKEGVMDKFEKVLEDLKGYITHLFEVYFENKVIELDPPKEGEPYQTRDGKPYPKEAFLYVPDPEKPSTWKLPIAEYVNGKLVVTRRKLAQAALAIGPKGFRGNRVQLPDGVKKDVIKKLLNWFKKLGITEEEIKKTFPYLLEAEEVDMDRLKELEEQLKAAQAKIAEHKKEREELVAELKKYHKAEFEAQVQQLVDELKLKPAFAKKALALYEANPEAAKAMLEAFAEADGEQPTLDATEARKSLATEPAPTHAPVSYFYSKRQELISKGYNPEEAERLALEAVDKAFLNETKEEE